jgi:sugar-specific transcriptional regulator TrmB
MKDELIEYGLSVKEVDIYLALLKAGDSTAARLSELTGVRRSTVYEVLESLKKRGLVTFVNKNKKTFFIGENPSTLIFLLKEKQEKINRILPGLNKLVSSSAEKPRVQVFEGKIGIKNAVEDMLNFKEILIYGASSTGDEVFEHYTENFARRRVKKKVFVRAVLEKDFSVHMSDEEIRKYTNVRTLKGFEKHNSSYFIYGDNLIIVNLRDELFAIKIKSSVLTESQRKVFEILWEIAN